MNLSFVMLSVTTVRPPDFWITTTSGSAPPGTSPYAELLSHSASVDHGRVQRIPALSTPPRCFTVVDSVGHAPQMPYYATGFVQCKDRYRNQTQLLEVANGCVHCGDCSAGCPCPLPL